MSVVLMAGVGWIVLSVTLAVVLGRTVRLAETRERVGRVPLPDESATGDAPPRFVHPLAGSSLGRKRR